MVARNSRAPFRAPSSIFQEAPKRFPGDQISWYFKPFWSPGAPGLHFDVQGSISSSRAPWRGPGLQEAPERFPGHQIQWCFEPFWSPEAPGLHFEVWARRQSDLLSYSRDLTTTRVCPKMVLKSAIFEEVQGPNHH